MTIELRRFPDRDDLLWMKQCTVGTMGKDANTPPSSELKASNWICDGEAGGTHWTGGRYEGFEQMEMILGEMKVRWHKDL